MSTPEFSSFPNLQSSTTDFGNVAEPEFGPDMNGTEEPSPFENLKTDKAKPPRSGRIPRKTTDVFGKLGQNKKPRSSVRQLKAEGKDNDREKIANLYVMLSMGVMPFRQSTAMALANNAEQCADAWIELARENDAVRRVLVAMIEGGVWGKMFAAHLPILMTLIPNSAFTIPGFPVNGFDVPPQHPEA